MKKLLLGLGSIASVVAPVAAVISCGDDSKTTTTGGTQSHVVTITDTNTVNAVKAGLTTTLGLTAANIGAVAAGDNLNLSIGNTGTKSMNFAHYTKVTFTAADDIHPGGSAVHVEAGDSLVIGTVASSRRATTSTLKAVLMGANGTNMSITLDSAKTAALQTSVLDKVVEHLEASKPGAGAGAGSTTGTTTVQVPAQIGNAANKATVTLLIMGAMPTHLTKANIEPAMTSLKALTGIAAVTEITFAVVATDGTNTVQKQFVVTVTAGKANDVDAIATAAANVAATDIVVDGGGTGAETPTHKTVVFSVASGQHAASTPWHNSFRDGQLVEGDIIEATVSGHTYSHTLTSGDVAALNTIKAKQNPQDEIVNKVAALIASESTVANTVTADQVKTSFGIDATTGSSTSGHTFTTGTTGSTGAVSTADVTVTYTSTSGAIKLTELVTKVMQVIGSNQPANVIIMIDAAKITVALTDWKQPAVTTKLSDAITNAGTSAACFDLAN